MMQKISFWHIYHSRNFWHLLWACVPLGGQANERESHHLKGDPRKWPVIQQASVLATASPWLPAQLLIPKIHCHTLYPELDCKHHNWTYSWQHMFSYWLCPLPIFKYATVISFNSVCVFMLLDIRVYDNLKNRFDLLINWLTILCHRIWGNAYKHRLDQECRNANVPIQNWIWINQLLYQCEICVFLLH